MLLKSILKNKVFNKIHPLPIHSLEGVFFCLYDKYIVDNNLVPDAFDTNEFWIINKTVKPSAIYYIYPGAMDYAYLMDHSCIGIELYSYIKIKEGAISEETISKHNGVLYPWELGIQEHQTEKITIDPTL